MNTLQQCLAEGFSVLLGDESQLLGGRWVKADTKERLIVAVEDVPMLMDPDQPAQAKQPVYTRISAGAGAVADPRKVGQFTEEKSGRWHKVLKYEETSGDVVTWKWICEAQRQ